jgi:hypothetical protein
MSVRGATFAVMDSAMNMMFKQVKLRYDKCKLTLLEKYENNKYPWILFTTEVEQVIKEVKPESQIWFLIQGKSTLYCNFIAIKKSKISGEQRKKFGEFLKTARIVVE